MDSALTLIQVVQLSNLTISTYAKIKQHLSQLAYIVVKLQSVVFQ